MDLIKLPLLPPINENSFLGTLLIKTKHLLSASKGPSFSTQKVNFLSKIENSGDAMYFLHIPKTAGTSVLTVLDDQFNYEEICDRHDWGELINDIPTNFSHAKLFRGHFCYGFYHQFTKKPIYLTMLRDPIKQIPSHFEQSRRNYFKRFNKEPPDDSLLEYLNHPKRNLVAKNMQTRHVAVDFDAIPIIKKLNNDEFNDFFRFNHPLFKQPKLRPAELLGNAKKNLEEFAFVGITERFEESMQLLCYTFGWKPLRYMPLLNMTPNSQTKSKMSDKELDAIKNVISLDQKLYDYACKLFDKKYSAMIKFLKESYYDNSFLNLNKNDLIYELLELHYANSFWNSKPKLEQINYDFSQSLMGSGWHPRERTPITHKFFRWTGPQTTSTIDLPLRTNKDMTISFQVSMSINPDMIDSLKFYVNNFETTLEKNRKHDNKVLFTTNVTSSILKENEHFTRLSFQINETKSPKDLDSNSDDSRKLGLAFEWIKITPFPDKE